MEYDTFYKLIDGLTPSESRTQTITYIKDFLPELKSELHNYVSAAYSIAGLMTTDFAHSLSDNDPLDEILTIAGELESNPSDAEELRKELIKKIESLD